MAKHVSSQHQQFQVYQLRTLHCIGSFFVAMSLNLIRSPESIHSKNQHTFLTESKSPGRTNNGTVMEKRSTNVSKYHKGKRTSHGNRKKK